MSLSGFLCGVEQFKLKSDEEGRVTVKAENPGQYLLIARNLTDDGSPGLYNDTKYTYTCYFILRKRK